MKSTFFNEPRAMAAVPCKKLGYVLGSANVEAITADRTVFFQTARLWPYKAINSVTGAPTANANPINVGWSGLAVSIAALTSLIVTAGEALATSTAHGLYTGDFVNINGGTPSGVNGAFLVYEATANTFKYRVAGSVADGPATGTITAAKVPALPWNIAAATTTPLVLTLPLGMKRALADIVARGTATDGLYVEWE